MRTIFARLLQAFLFWSIAFSTQVSAESLDGVSTPIKAQVGQTVQLDPTDGFIADGEATLSPIWSWETRPATSVSDFSSSDALRPFVTVDVPGTYVATLDLFSADDPDASAPIYSTKLTLSTDNTPPVARIQARGLPEQSTLTLSGARSYDVDGDRLTYAWSVVSTPLDGTVQISEATALAPEVSYSGSGDFVIALTVQDSSGLTSSPAQYRISTLAGGGPNSCRSSFDTVFTNSGADRVVFDLGDVTNGPAIDAQIESFDVNSNGRERTFDTLKFVFGGTAYQLSTRRQFLDFAYYLEHDGDQDSDVLISQNSDERNLTFTWGVGKGSITLKNLVNNGVPRGGLLARSADFCGVVDIFSREPTKSLPNDGSARVIYDLGDVSNGPTEDVVIPDFDVNGGREQTFDTLRFVFDGNQFELSNKWQFRYFTNLIEHDGDQQTDAFISPNPSIKDLTFTWGEGKGSVTLKNVVDTSGLSRASLINRSVDFYEADVTAERQLAPFASARFDQIFANNGALDAYLSTDLDGDALLSAFNVLVAPTGADASMTVGDDGQSVLSADVAGEYLVGLSVSDGNGFGTDHVLMTTGPQSNLRPTARIIGGNETGVGSTVLLDGSQSFDLNGDALSYQWALLSAPETTGATVGGQEPSLSFVPDIAGQYVIQLVVSDAASSSVPTTYVVDTDQVVPVAEAGPDALASSAGMGSPDGTTSVADVPVFDWSATGLTNGSGATIDDATSGLPMVQLAGDDTAGFSAAVAQLIVSDQGQTSFPDTVFVGTGNLRPELSATTAILVPAGDMLDLSGSDFAFDANGDALTFTWSLILKPQGSAAAVDETNPQSPTFVGEMVAFTPDLTGEYLIQLTAADGALFATPVILRVTATNAAPVALALATSPVFVGEVATLDGTGSFDPNADALGYFWALTSAPAGSSATIPDPFGPVASFVPDQQGSYVFELAVSDAEFSVVSNAVTVEVPNRAPTANLQGPGTSEVGVQVPLTASGSTDPDGDVLQFQWSVISAPNGSIAEISVLNANGDATLAADIAGEYAFSVTVSDGVDTDTAEGQLLAVSTSTAPVLDPLENSYAVEVGQTLQFTLSATAGAAEVRYFARPLPLPAGMQLNAETGVFSFTPNADQEGDFELTFGASNGIETDTQTVTVTVSPATGTAAALAGRVLDATDFAAGVTTPLAGVTVRADRAGVETVTDGDGRFTLGGLGVGFETLSTVVDPSGPLGRYSSDTRAVTPVENQTVELPTDILLTSLNGNCAPVLVGVDTVLLDATGLRVTVPADSVVDGVGTPYDGEVCLGTLPQLFDHAGFPDGTQACQIYALDAPGATFQSGILAELPNLDGLPSGANARVWLLDNGLGSFTPNQLATVSADGASVPVDGLFTGGSGGLFTVLPRRPKLAASADQPSGNNTLTLFEGNLSETYELPTYRAFSQDQKLALAYNSATADPKSVVSADVTISPDAGLPEDLSARISLGGLIVDDTPRWNPRVDTQGNANALLGDEVTLRQSSLVDVTGLTSGRYDLSYVTRAKYACSTVGAKLDRETYIRNETASPYGAGWAIDGLQKLIFEADGGVSIVDDNSIVPFEPEATFTEFDGDPIIFPATGVQGLAIADYNGDGLDDIAYGDSGTGSIGFIYNLGDRQFEAGAPIVVANPNDVPADLTQSYGPNLRDVVPIDINGDGLTDLAYGTQLQQRLDYLVNEGGGTFRAEPGYAFTELVRDLEKADYDNDGFEEIAVAAANRGGFGDRSRIYIDYVGPTGRTLVQSLRDFRPDGQVNQIVAGDIDNDGFVDIGLRMNFRFRYMFNDGDRTFTNADPRQNCDSAHVLGDYSDMADFNEDGLLDVVISELPVSRFCRNEPPRLDVYINRDGRTFNGRRNIDLFSGTETSGFVFALDTDGDRHLDIVMSQGDSVNVYRGLGDGSFLPVETGALDYNLDFLEPYDIDHNGALDLISAQRFSVTIQFSKDPDGTSLIAGPGEFSTLEKQPDGAWIRRYKDGNIAEFNADGRQTAEVDTRGNRREFAYDGDGRLTTVTDQTGGQMTLSYTADGQLQSIIYPDGRETLFDITPEGTFAGVTEPDGGEMRYRYDEEGRLVAVTDQRGNTTEHRYTSVGSYSGSLFPNRASIANTTGATLGLDDLDAPQPLAYVAPEDRVSTHTDEKGGVTRIVVNEFGAIVETTDPIGRVTRFTRNADNLVTRVERPTDNPADGAGTLVRVDEMTYDTRGNMTSLTMAVGTTLERTRRYEYEPVFSNVTKFIDFDGFETTYEYDEFGDLIRMVDAEGNVSTYEYNIAGLISRSVDERGQVMSYNYDTRLNRVDMIHPDLSFDRNIYDDRGNVIERIEAFGRPEQRSLLLEFDIEDRIISQEMTDSTGAGIDGKAFFEYDIAGNLVATVDETGLRTEYVFDNMNQQIAETSPAYGETTYAYNGSSEMTSETDAEGITRTWDYDIVGRMTRTVDGVGNVSIFEYDVSDNLERVTDGRGNVTNFGFDILERRISRTNPINQTIQMAYDLRDNLIQVTRENGELETATYDGLSRRLSVTTVDNTLSYSYDEEGNLLRAADDDSALSMTYDLRDRLASVTTDGAVGPQPDVTLSYTYDALNQRTSLTDSLGGIWSYGFDEKSRLASITAPWGDTHIMEYDPAGRRTELVNTTGRQTLAGYASDRLSQLEHFQNAIPVARSGFAYSEDGAVSLLRDIDDATQSRSLAYDGINRLLQVAEGVPAADGGVPIPVEDYAYDENGNRTVSHLSNSYVVDDHNRLLQDDTYSYGYDEKGNRVTRTRTSDGRVETFTYNSVNQLIGVSSTDGLDAAYAYDALGRRIAKTLNGEVTSYVYDIGNFYDITGHDRLLDFQNGALATRWLHGQQIDEPVGYESYAADTTAGAGTAYALHADRQGSVIAVTEQSTDTVVARYVYDAFGQREQTVSTVLQDYGFTGREIDPETDLYYYRARHYDPGQGRFIQSDPLGFAAGDLNLYAYTWNDPANWSDPSGLSASGDASRTSAGAAALARQSARRVGRGARCAVNKVSSFLSGIGRELVRGGDLSQLKVQNLKCRVRVKAPKCSCRSGGFAGAAAGAAAGYAAGGGFSSFPAGTEVLTPNGRVAIESLHEGDLVIARDEDNGMSGVFPVTALMSRTVPEVIWLTLENAEGKSTRMGVTSEHPLFTVGEGWVDAGELVAGDVIRDSALQELSVLTVTLDTTPQRVHNLEVAGAHTYFAGDMEAWGHNALNFGKPGRIVALCMHLVFGGRDSDADGKADTYKPSSVRQSQSINTKPPQQNEQTCDPKGGRKRK